MAESNGRFVVGLIGSGITTSLTPPLHELEADCLGLRYVYQTIDIAELAFPAEEVGELVAKARILGFAGLNITYPCKQLVVPHLDELSPAAATLGAVNTVVFADGKAVGHNTDCAAFEASLTRGLRGVPMQQVVVLGAGGAGAAVGYAVLSLQAGKAVIVDIEPDHARQLAEDLGGHFGPDRVSWASAEVLESQLAESDGLINATPVGMASVPGIPLSPGLLRGDLWVADVVYRPLKTALLSEARRLGCRTLHGGGMAVFQAVASFHLFTGVEPDAQRMFGYFERLIAAEDGALGFPDSSSGGVTCVGQ